MKTFEQPLSDELDLAIAFHGHKCPALAVGLRAGHAALDALGVERAHNQELRVESETGEGHAMGCFLDGLSVVTGCTCGKGNLHKLHHDKIAFTLVEVATGRAVRVGVKGDFLEHALHSPFVEQRRQGVPPEEIPAEITDPAVARILELPEADFLQVGNVKQVVLDPPRVSFEVRPCASCQELTFVTGMVARGPSEFVCRTCAGHPL